MKNTNYFIDLDDVLFDTGALIEDFKKMLVRCGASQESMAAYYQSQGIANPAYMSRTYHLIRHPEQLGTIFGVGSHEVAAMVGEIQAIIDRFPTYVYEDATAFLEETRDQKRFIVSFGATDWQTLKIERSGLGKHFAGLALTHGKHKSDAILDFHRNGLIDSVDGIFIDDKGSEIMRMRTELPQIRSYRLYRPGGRYNDQEYVPDGRQVADLRELFLVCA
ncbi:MAG: hypothetical protein HGA31_01120 [Candidatus Moranbacteria bacterium]|nr:hypothetical protein [Candidatus Moranbacteria bacterium]